VYLTDKAREVGPQIIIFADELDANMRKNFSPDEMLVFERVLKQIGGSQAQKSDI